VSARHHNGGQEPLAGCPVVIPLFFGWPESRIAPGGHWYAFQLVRFVGALLGCEARKSLARASPPPQRILGQWSAAQRRRAWPSPGKPACHSVSGHEWLPWQPIPAPGHPNPALAVPARLERSQKSRRPLLTSLPFVVQRRRPRLRANRRYASMRSEFRAQFRQPHWKAACVPALPATQSRTAHICRHHRPRRPEQASPVGSRQ
jgi:hypothetical protein